MHKRLSLLLLGVALISSCATVTPQGQVIATGVTGGDPASVMPGNYSVRIKGQTSRAQSVTIESKATATVKL